MKSSLKNGNINKSNKQTHGITWSDALVQKTEIKGGTNLNNDDEFNISFSSLGSSMNDMSSHQFGNQLLTSKPDSSSNNQHDQLNQSNLLNLHNEIKKDNTGIPNNNYNVFDIGNENDSFSQLSEDLSSFSSNTSNDNKVSVSSPLVNPVSQINKPGMFSKPNTLSSSTTKGKGNLLSSLLEKSKKISQKNDVNNYIEKNSSKEEQTSELLKFSTRDNNFKTTPLKVGGEEINSVDSVNDDFISKTSKFKNNNPFVSRIDLNINKVCEFKNGKLQCDLNIQPDYVAQKDYNLIKQLTPNTNTTTSRRENKYTPRLITPNSNNFSFNNDLGKLDYNIRDHVIIKKNKSQCSVSSSIEKEKNDTLGEYFNIKSLSIGVVCLFILFIILIIFAKIKNSQNYNSKYLNPRKSYLKHLRYRGGADEVNPKPITVNNEANISLKDRVVPDINTKIAKLVNSPYPTEIVYNKDFLFKPIATDNKEISTFNLNMNNINNINKVNGLERQLIFFVKSVEISPGVTKKQNCVLVIDKQLESGAYESILIPFNTIKYDDGIPLEEYEEFFFSNMYNNEDKSKKVYITVSDKKINIYNDPNLNVFDITIDFNPTVLENDNLLGRVFNLPPKKEVNVNNIEDYVRNTSLGLDVNKYLVSQESLLIPIGILDKISDKINIYWGFFLIKNCEAYTHRKVKIIYDKDGNNLRVIDWYSLEFHK